MADPCEKFYQETHGRIEAAVKARWPETLRSDRDPFNWAAEQRHEEYQKMKHLERQMEEFWLNGAFDEMKKLCTDWGRAVLGLFREYAGYLQREAAL